MRNATLVCIALILAAAPLLAADTPATQPAAPKGGIWGPTLGMVSYEELYKVCEFTPDQQKKIQAVEDARQASIAKSQKDREAALEHYRKAQASKDQKDLAQAIEEFNSSGQALNESYGKTEKAVVELMTHAQKEKWRQYSSLKSIKGGFNGVALTDAQWDKIMELYEQFARDNTLTAGEIASKISVKVLDTLTDAQRLQRVRGIWNYKQMADACHFTDEQWQKLAKLQDALDRQLPEASEKANTAVARLTKAIADAQAAGDAKTVWELQQQYGEAYKPLNTLYKDNQDKVQALLTDKQKKDWEAAKKAQLGLVTPGSPAPGGWR